MTLQRIFAVLSAVLLVGTVAVATLGPPEESLGSELFMLYPGLPDGLHGLVKHVLGDWMWQKTLMPLMQRPAWLVPASLGVICLGVSLSLSGRKSTRRSKRRS